MAMWEFIKELLQGTFWSYNSIGSWLGFAVFIFWLFLPKLKWQGKVKKGLEAISWPYRLLIILGLLFISVILTSYSMYTNKERRNVDLQKEITTLQNDLLDAQKQAQTAPITTIKPVTKQEIRVFLESINPEILRKIDIRQKEIPILIGAVKQVKLSNLSERPDFKNFLSFTRGYGSVVGGGSNGYIDELGESGMKSRYILCPKDALVQ